MAAAKPSDLSAWISRVRELSRLRQWDQARTVLARACTLYPDHAGLADMAFLIQPEWKSTMHAGLVRLRAPEPRDAAFFKRCFDDVEFMRDFHRTANRLRSETEIQKILARWSASSVYESASVHWVLEAGAGPECKLYGLLSLVNISANHRRAEFLIGLPGAKAGAASLSVCAALLAMDFAFNRVGLHKLTSIVFADNVHSQQSTLALGFEQEGFRRQHLRDLQTGQWLDCFENGMTETAFRTHLRLSKLSRRLLGRDITLSVK